jgi:hypothetical protein
VPTPARTTHSSAAWSSSSSSRHGGSSGPMTRPASGSARSTLRARRAPSTIRARSSGCFRCAGWILGGSFLVATTRRPLRTRRPTAFPDPHHRLSFEGLGRWWRNISGAHRTRSCSSTNRAWSSRTRRRAQCAVWHPAQIILSACLRGALLGDPGATHHPGMDLGDLCALSFLLHCLLSGHFPEGATCRSGNECGQEEQ